jgi:chromosome segregation protein
VLGGEERERKDRLSSLSAQQRQADEQLSELGSRHSSMTKDLEAETGKTVDVALGSELDEVKNRIYEARSRIKALNEVNIKKSAENEALMEERKTLEARIKNWITDEQAKTREVDKLKLDYEQSLQGFTKLEEEYSNANKDINNLQQKLEEQRIKLSRKQSELQTLERTSGGLQQAVKAVLGLRKVILGIHGPVMQLGEVTDIKYNLPLQVAAGGRMQHVVVSGVDDAAKCIDYLRKKKIGRCTFLPLDKLSFRSADKPPKESIGFARDFIKCSAKFGKVFEYVFGDTIIVKDIHTAKKIGVGSWRMVTLDGDLLELSGAMTGGHMLESYVITFSNMEELENEIKVLEGSLGSLESDYEGKLEVKRKLDSTLSALRDRVRKSKEVIDNLVFEKNLITERRTSLRERLNKIVESAASIEGGIQENSVEVAKLEKSASSDEKKLKGLVERRGLGEATKLDTLKDSLRDIEVGKTKLVEKLAFLSQQSDELKARLSEIASSKQEINLEINSLRDKVKGLQKGLDGLEKAHESLGGEIEKLMGERGRVEEEITQLGSRIGEIEHGMDGISQQLNDFMIEKTKISTRLEDLQREYGKYGGVGLIEKSVKDLEDMAAKLEQEITEFGSVNMRAIETYDIIKKEFDDITEKLDTLKKERQSIFEFMDKIESRKKATFMEAFEKVKTNFERIFAELSDGKGTLTLDTPMNISESGLMITASPGGKRLMSLDAMSGGEKVLTSAAFLLALQQYKPAFFYVVDELDAALDKMNSVMLAEMLAHSNSQFLMVTHNNNMLRYMDSAIGVSMVYGVSQIVGVRFNGEDRAAGEMAA